MDNRTVEQKIASLERTIEQYKTLGNWNNPKSPNYQRDRELIKDCDIRISYLKSGTEYRK